ncbi:MAG: hypothetical protein ABIL09_27265, partial [Gemmatimonadota bacterium]
ALEDLARFTRANAVDFEDIIIVCRRFAEDSGLLEDESVRQAIARVEATGGHASMIMLGNAVFSTRPFEGSVETALSLQPARLLGD